MTLTVSHLTFAYPKAPPVLEDVSFTVPAGDFLSVLGANGAGKSTLFRCLLGGLEGYTGAISLDGRDVRTFSRRELAARIAYIPQIHRPTFGYSVLDTTLMGLTRQLSPFRSPTPEMEKIASVTMAPPKRVPNCMPMIVRMGIRALGKAWRKIMMLSFCPLDRAVRT